MTKTRKTTSHGGGGGDLILLLFDEVVQSAFGDSRAHQHILLHLKLNHLRVAAEQHLGRRLEHHVEGEIDGEFRAGSALRGWKAVHGHHSCCITGEQPPPLVWPTPSATKRGKRQRSRLS